MIISDSITRLISIFLEIAIIFIQIFNSTLPIRQKFSKEVGFDVLFEYFSDIVSCYVEILLNLRNRRTLLFLHFLMTFTEISQINLSSVKFTVLTDFPESQSSYSIYSNIRGGMVCYILAHLNHGKLLKFTNFTTSAYSHYQMFWFDYRHKVNSTLEHCIHLFDQILPSFNTHV